MKRLRLPLPIPKFRRAKVVRPTPGSRPGTLAPRPELPPPTVTRFEYDAVRLERAEVPLDQLEQALQPLADAVVWVDVQGIGDAEILQRIGVALELHPLTLEDIAHTHQRPKLEEFDKYLFATLRAVRVKDDGTIGNEQLSFILRGNLLVTFQEEHGDGFEPVRTRLREAKGPIRHQGADYLFYALLDATIDGYFPVLELYGETMEQLEDEIRAEPRPQLSQAVHALRRELRQLRRTTWPLRDLMATFGRGEVEGIGVALRPAFRDCHDHVIQVVEFVEASRERASDLGDLYQTMVSEKTNQVMKVLTIMSTIFIPLTFLAGLYGMNFDPDKSPYNMPELKWRYGYPAFWLVLTVTLLGMLWFFRRRGWIGGDSASRKPRD